MPKSEERWLEAARRLDEQALGELYDALSPELYRYAYRLVGNVEQAEDLLGETFLRFFRRDPGREEGPKEHLRAYLYRTLHNLVVDWHRRVEPVWSELAPEQIAAGESANPAVAVQHHLDGQEARALLWSSDKRAETGSPIRLFQDLSTAEIAQILEKTEGSVKALQHRGLASLRRLMIKSADEQESSR